MVFVWCWKRYKKPGGYRLDEEESNGEEHMENCILFPQQPEHGNVKLTFLVLRSRMPRALPPCPPYGETLLFRDAQAYKFHIQKLLGSSIITAINLETKNNHNKSPENRSRTNSENIYIYKTHLTHHKRQVLCHYKLLHSALYSPHMAWVGPQTTTSSLTKL
jgi:hypothetical protein